MGEIKNPHDGIKIPHAQVVIAFCVAALLGYTLVSVWVIFWGDAAQKGDMIGTWKSFAVAAFGFWVGASSGGKIAANPDSPQSVKIDQPANDPVPTTNVKPEDIPNPLPNFNKVDE